MVTLGKGATSGWSVHLLSAVNQTLLDGRNALLLLDLLLDLGDLCGKEKRLEGQS